MSRHLTPLSRPTSLQPSLTGPRDVVPGARVHTIATPADDADIPPAPAPTNKPKGTTMPASPNIDAILAALKKRTSADTNVLHSATGISLAVLAVTLSKMAKDGLVVRVMRGVYALPGTDLSSVAPAKAGAQSRPKKTKPAKPATKRKPKPAPESFADGVKARERELDALTRTNGTDLPLLPNHDPAKSLGQYNADFKSVHDVFKQLGIVVGQFGSISKTPPNHEATALPCRAIATAAGGALITRGNLITAELSAEELNVLHALRG